MSQYVPVNVYVVDNTPAANPIQGAVVKVFQSDGVTPISEQLTDSTGLAAFMLGSDFTYQLRYYKFQTSFPKPQVLAVLDPPAENGVQVVGTPFAPPISQDARLCIAYGFFRRVDGSPAPFTDIQFISKFDPLIMDGAGILNERVIARTDNTGYVQIPLIRFGQYSVIVAGMEDLRRDITVPDQTNVNLPNLIFPVVNQIVFDPPPPFNLVIGTDFQTTPSIITSDGNPDPNYWDVLWSTDDQSIAAVLPGGGVLTLRGFLPGTCNLIAKRRDNSIISIPDPGIVGGVTSINVST